jgi:uncharacterized protein
MQLGDARAGKLADNVVGFARTLRRAGFAIDPARIALAQQALLLISIGNKVEVQAALETIFVNNHGQKPLFQELFLAYFKDPELANKLLAQLLPQSQGKAQNRKNRARVQEALTPQRQNNSLKPSGESKIQFDAAMTASQHERLRQADFNLLSSAEFELVEQLARRLKILLPQYQTRRTQANMKGDRIDWTGYFQSVAQFGLDAPINAWRLRVYKPTPLVILIDVSGSMERYARMMLTFLHASTRAYKQRSVFTFGTQLTNLAPAFLHSDPDLMLSEASTLIGDFAGGTKLGDTLCQLRSGYARHFQGRRTTVLIVSDGLDTGDASILNEQLAWLKRHSANLLWCNPLMRYEGYTPSATGPSLLDRYVDASVAIHNLSSLEQLAQSFTDLLKFKP